MTVSPVVPGMPPRRVTQPAAAAAPAPKPAQPGVVSRFRQRLFHPFSSDRTGQPALPPPGAPVPKKQIGFQASVAELLLVTRLRARRKPQPATGTSPEVLERAARIVFVTCQNWFAEPDRGQVGHRTRL